MKTYTLPVIGIMTLGAAAFAAALNKLQEGRWGDIQWDKPPNSHRRDISATKFSGN